MEELDDKKASRKAKKEENLDDDVLPTNGLYNEDGHLFYHASTQPLTKAQYKRAEEHGINLRSKKNFTLEECIQIFKNWNHYATENNIQLGKALEYLTARKSEKHIIQHQKDNQFWVQLCHGLPHRSGVRVKTRAQQMMTDDFMKEVDWSKLAKQIREKFFNYEAYDEVTMQKAQKLTERGYSASYVADILEVPVSRAISMTTKIRNLEGRTDQAMLISVFESALSLGLSLSKLRRQVIIGDKHDLDRLRQNIKLYELSLNLHVSEQHCSQLLKALLKSILAKYEEISKEELSEDVAWEATLKEFSDKPPIEEHQLYKALEIFCKHIGKEDTQSDLSKDLELAKLVKSHGITGFHCDRPEFRYIYYRICQEFLGVLEKNLFDHFRREFRTQLKLHCLLWSHKMQEIWEKVTVPDGKTRYEAVLDSELSNPLVSKMTLKFLKNQKVVEWIMEPRPSKNRRNIATRRLEAAVEAFILYIHQKYSGEFRFPAKLSKLVSSNTTIKSVLSEIEDPENSEYLSIQEARKRVEEASGNKILMRIKNKSIIKRDSEDDSDNDEEDPEALKALLEHSRDVESKMRDKRRQEIDAILEKANPEKRRKKFKKGQEGEVEGPDEIWLSEELYQLKKVMNRANKVVYKSKEFIEEEDSSSDEDERRVEEEDEDGESMRAYDTDSDEDLDAPENSDEPESDPGELEELDASSDVREVSNGTPVSLKEVEEPFEETFTPAEPSTSDNITVRKEKKRTHLDSDDMELAEIAPEPSEEIPETSEDIPEKKKKKKRKRRDSELLEASEPVMEPSEDVEYHEGEKKKKRKHRDSEAPENIEDPEDIPTPSEDVTTKKKKHQNQVNIGAPEPALAVFDDIEDPGDVPTTSEDVPTEKKKKKKRKHRDSEKAEAPELAPAVSGDMEDPEDIPTTSEHVPTQKKKKRKHRDSEDTEALELSLAVFGDMEDPEDVPTTSEDVPTEKKKKKKRQHRDSEKTEASELAPAVSGDMEDPEDVPTTSGSVTKKKKKKKKKNQDDVEDPDDIPITSEDVPVEKTKNKKRKHQDSEAQVEVDAPEASEDVAVTKKKKKHKKHRKEENLEDN